MVDNTSWTRQTGVPKDTTQVLVPAGSAILQIPIDQIRSSPHQVRRLFDEEGIKSLADSIAIEGLIQPITVRKVDDGYELIAGERRLRAVKSLGLPAIEARVIEVISEASASAKGLVENLQRQDLNPIEEADGFDWLHKLDSDYWTHERIAEVAGRSRVYITQSLGFLKLPKQIKDDVRRLTLNRSQIIEIMRLLTPEDQITASEQAKDLSWKETRQLIDSMLSGKMRKKADGGSDADPHPTPPAPYDPLSNVWAQLASSQKGASDDAWKCNWKDDGWHFWVKADAANPQARLAVWFRAMAEALDPSPAPHAPDGALIHRLMPTTPEEFRWAEEDQKNLWLPKNNDEVGELERLAQQSQGPWPIYARIFGEKSFMAQRMAVITWQEIGVSDPATGCRQIVDGLRQMHKM
jgi:ParB family chromosome partitioning protein